MPAVDRFPLVLSRQALRRGHKDIRGLMSKGSEAALLHFARINPQSARGFLKQLTAWGNKVKTVVFPAVLAEGQNREVARMLASDREIIAKLVDEHGVLDLRRAGLKQKLPVIDLCPKRKPLTIEDYSKALRSSRTALEKDHDLGDLFLFKTVLRARIDLYAAGEARSAAIRRGEKPGLTPALERVKNFLDLLAAEFPFGATGERQMVKDDLEIAALLLARKNNPAADMKLAYLFQSLEKMVARETVARARLAPRVMKVAYAGKGKWNIGTNGYRTTPAGIVQKVKVESTVNTPELLSMLQHVVDSIRGEKTVNERFIRDLVELLHILPDRFGRLLEIFELFQNYDALNKDKACAELEGAVQLVTVGTDQALRLAKELVGLAVKDVDLRQAEISAHEQRFVRLKAETENEVGKRLTNYIGGVIKTISDQEIMSDPEIAGKTADRVGAFLGTFLNGELREPWLRRVKSRFVGLVRVLRRLKVETEQKKHFMELVVGQRDLYLHQREEIRHSNRNTAEGKTELAALKANVIENARRNLVVIGQIDRASAAGLRRLAEFILLAEFDFRNRNGEEIAQEAFLAGKAPILAALDDLLNDRVEAFSHDGQPLGEIGRIDALKMELDYRPLIS